MGGWKPLRVCRSSLSSHGPFHVPGSILRPSGFRPRRSIQSFSTVLSRAGGCPVSRRFSRRDFFITKNVLLIKQICFWRVDIVLTIEHTDFARRGRRRNKPTGESSQMPEPRSKPLLSSEARKGRLTVSEAEQVRSPRPKGARRLEQVDYDRRRCRLRCSGKSALESCSAMAHRSRRSGMGRITKSPTVTT